MKFCDSVHGGLNKLAEQLDVQRIGPQHQAGSDSLLTSLTFMKLCDRYFGGVNGAGKHMGVLYGLGARARACVVCVVCALLCACACASPLLWRRQVLSYWEAIFVCSWQLRHSCAVVRAVDRARPHRRCSCCSAPLPAPRSPQASMAPTTSRRTEPAAAGGTLQPGAVFSLFLSLSGTGVIPPPPTPYVPETPALALASDAPPFLAPCSALANQARAASGCV